MRAMVYRGPYKVAVQEKPVPLIEHPNDAVVRVGLAAICGSDLHLYHGMMPDTRVGMTFGHEFIGVVDQVGPSVGVPTWTHRTGQPSRGSGTTRPPRAPIGNCRNSSPKMRRGNVRSNTGA